MLEKLDMRADIQEIFKLTPHDKQVMMFSATLATEMRSVCKKFMTNVRMIGGGSYSSREGGRDEIFGIRFIDEADHREGSQTNVSFPVDLQQPMTIWIGSP